MLVRQWRWGTEAISLVPLDKRTAGHAVRRADRPPHYERVIRNG